MIRSRPRLCQASDSFKAQWMNMTSDSFTAQALPGIATTYDELLTTKPCFPKRQLIAHSVSPDQELRIKKNLKIHVGIDTTLRKQQNARQGGLRKSSVVLIVIIC